MGFIGGAEGDRTPGLRIANAALCQTELLPHDRRILGSLRGRCQVRGLRMLEDSVPVFQSGRHEDEETLTYFERVVLRGSAFWNNITRPVANVTLFGNRH